MSKFDHIFLPDIIQKFRYSPTHNGRGKQILEKDRTTHAAYLQNKFSEIWESDEILRLQRNAIALPTRNGTYVEFKGAENQDLLSNSIESIRSGVRLLNVRKVYIDNDHSELIATVYIPNGKEFVFLRKLEDYADPQKDIINENKGTQKPRNANLINSIEDLKLAILRSLWTDPPQYFPTSIFDWYEVWLKIDEDKSIEEQILLFKSILNSLHLGFKENYLHFPERAVILVYANDETLQELFYSSDQLAEIKQGQETSSFWINENPADQRLWVDDILSRLFVDNHSEVSVCVMDTGINNGHSLIAPFLLDENCLTCDPTWGIADKNGHGTQMAGVITYGDLSKVLPHDNPIYVSHTLCSVKILPDHGENDKELWGKITTDAVSRTEIKLGKHKVIYCMAITSPNNENLGKPSSWSGAIDYLSYGDGLASRLVIVSAGNISFNDRSNIQIWEDYPHGSNLRPVQNPAQSWNALTIGAFTEKVIINDNRFDAFQRVALSGGLSPFSTTSTLWDKSNPIKPEVLFEGGNLVKTDDVPFIFDTHDDLSVLTTHHRLQIRQFDTIRATSSATALAANLAARIQVKYPNLWAESIRGLMIHSAQWSEVMIDQFPVARREDMRTRLRCCGYGVPSEYRALSSTENGFTFIAQEALRPFIRERSKKGSSSIKLNEMHFYNLPWPKDLLESLGEIEVIMRITLSYFIEPSPGEIGWKDRYRYPSCGLRFEVNTSTDTEEGFKSRINKLMQDEEEDDDTQKNDSQRWGIGSTNRNQGSVHSDFIRTTGAQLASCNLIAVYPIGGWWKTRNYLNKYNENLRYSMIVSLDTPDEKIDLYNVVKAEIENIIKTPVPVKIPTAI